MKYFDKLWNMDYIFWAYRDFCKKIPIHETGLSEIFCRRESWQYVQFFYGKWVKINRSVRIIFVEEKVGRFCVECMKENMAPLIKNRNFICILFKRFIFKMSQKIHILECTFFLLQICRKFFENISVWKDKNEKANVNYESGISILFYFVESKQSG